MSRLRLATNLARNLPKRVKCCQMKFESQLSLLDHYNHASRSCLTTLKTSRMIWALCFPTGKHDVHVVSH